MPHWAVEQAVRHGKQYKYLHFRIYEIVRQ